MASKRSRTRQTRRDRRKAKESGYRRLPKKAGRVGHGTAKTLSQTNPQRQPSKQAKTPRKVEALLAPLAEIVGR